MPKKSHESEKHSKIVPVSAALEIDVADTIVVQGPSEVTIAKAGEPHTYQFGSGLSSGEIVSTSLAQEDLTDVTPPDIQSFLILAINQMEKFSRESKGKKTIDEHSFKFSLGIFSYEFKRKIEKDQFPRERQDGIAPVLVPSALVVFYPSAMSMS